MSKPRVTALDQKQLDELKKADFYPHRQKKEDNSQERMNTILEEANKLFKHPSSQTPTKEEYPHIHNELPTLWAMIEEGKFKYWEKRDQNLLLHMITLNLKVVANQMSDDDAEKNAGNVLASRFLPNLSKEGGR